VGAGGTFLLCLAALLVLGRARLRRGRPAPPLAETWGCGYAFPSARMQYTGSSFAQILVQGFGWVLRPRIDFRPPRGPFPRGARFGTLVPEPVLDRALVPAVLSAGRGAAWLRGLFPTRIHFYAVLVLLTLVAMLAWRLLWW
jgi:hypothetical protein